MLSSSLTGDGRSNMQIKWVWFDGMTWQSYNGATNRQIENAYLEQRASIDVHQGECFAQSLPHENENVYRIYFNYHTHPPSFHQINVVTKDQFHIKRTLCYPRNHHQFLCHSPLPNDVHVVNGNGNENGNHDHEKQLDKKIKNKKQKQKKKEKGKKKKKSRHSKSKSAAVKNGAWSLPSALSFSSSSSSSSALLSPLQRISVYKLLYTAGFSKHVIDQAIQVFNAKYHAQSAILSDSAQIVQALTHIIRTGTCSHDDQEEEEDDEEDEAKELRVHDGDDECTDLKQAELEVHALSSDTSSKELDCGTTAAVTMDFRIGAWMEVNVDGVWTPSRIVNVVWSARIASITLEYQDENNWRRCQCVTLSGADINRNKCRPIHRNGHVHTNGHCPRLPPPAADTSRGRFEFDDARLFNQQHQHQHQHHNRKEDIRDNESVAHRNNGFERRTHGTQKALSSSSSDQHTRFNRSKLSSKSHRLSFVYQKGGKQHDEKHAKHPSEYINRRCFKCKGSGKCALQQQMNASGADNNNNHNNHNYHYEYSAASASASCSSSSCMRCHSTGYVQLACAKCINASGVYRKRFSLVHSQCRGQGCSRCQQQGKYPLLDVMCNHCKGSGVYRTKCGSCNIAQSTQPPPALHAAAAAAAHNGHGHSHAAQQRYNTCIGGYRLPVMVPFRPKREAHAVHGMATASPHGNHNDMEHMKRLYHAANQKSAEGIIRTGLIQLPVAAAADSFDDEGEDENGIHFTDNLRSIEIKAKKLGYLVIADVFIGNVKDEYYRDAHHDMDFHTLHAMGYDSVKHWDDVGVEYVVYSYDQVWVHVVLPFDQINFTALK